MYSSTSKNNFCWNKSLSYVEHDNIQIILFQRVKVCKYVGYKHKPWQNAHVPYQKLSQVYSSGNMSQLL